MKYGNQPTNQATNHAYTTNLHYMICTYTSDALKV